MPRTPPWDAPEWHHRGFQISEAMKMDVYSFGMLCFWLLFKENEAYPSQNDIRELKGNDRLRILAQQLVMKAAGLNEEKKSSLNRFFELTLIRDPDGRSQNFVQLLQLLDQDG